MRRGARFVPAALVAAAVAAWSGTAASQSPGPRKGNAARDGDGDGDGGRKVVLVELFTSQG